MIGKNRRLTSALASYLYKYLDFKRSLGFTSFADDRMYYAYDFDHYLTFRDVSSVEQLDEAFVANWMHSIPNHSASTKNAKLCFARGFLGYLIRLGLLKENSAKRIPALKTKKYKPYIYSLKEIERILGAARGLQRKYPGSLTGWTMETMVFLFYACGLRRKEAVNLNVEDVDFEEATLSLWDTKFHKERLVPFSPAVGRRLQAYLACPNRAALPRGKKDSLFAHLSGRYSEMSITHLFNTLLRRAGIVKPRGRGGPRLHDLRHTFAVHRLYKWYQEGHDIMNKLPLLSYYMGHVDIEATQIYLTVTQALLREGDRRFQETFGDVAQKTLDRAFGRNKK